MIKWCRITQWKSIFKLFPFVLCFFYNFGWYRRKTDELMKWVGLFYINDIWSMNHANRQYLFNLYVVKCHKQNDYEMDSVCHYEGITKVVMAFLFGNLKFKLYIPYYIPSRWNFTYIKKIETQMTFLFLTSYFNLKLLFLPLFFLISLSWTILLLILTILL